MSALISCIVPVYNDERAIERDAGKHFRANLPTIGSHCRRRWRRR